MPPRGAKLPGSVLPPGSPGISPSGTCQRIFPLFRSYAVSCDHGGPIADSPLEKLLKKSTGESYATNPAGAPGIAAGAAGPRAGPAASGGAAGAPALAPPPRRPGAVPGAYRRVNTGSSFETMKNIPRCGLIAELPQFAPPLWPGIWMVPFKLGGV